MSTTVKIGWLHDKNGDKFAPKTLISQVQTSDGVLLEDKIQADLNEVKECVTNIDYSALAFDTTEIVIDVSSSITTTSMLGKAVLGKMILA